MKFAVSLLMLGMLLSACNRQMTDEQICHGILGRWKADEWSIANKPDGSYVRKSMITVTSNVTLPCAELIEIGTWQVKNGCLLLRATNEPWINHRVNCLKVGSLNDHEMILSHEGKAGPHQIALHKE